MSGGGYWWWDYILTETFIAFFQSRFFSMVNVVPYPIFIHLFTPAAIVTSRTDSIRIELNLFRDLGQIYQWHQSAKMSGGALIREYSLSQ